MDSLTLRGLLFFNGALRIILLLALFKLRLMPKLKNPLYYILPILFSTTIDQVAYSFFIDNAFLMTCIEYGSYYLTVLLLFKDDLMEKTIYYGLVIFSFVAINMIFNFTLYLLPESFRSIINLAPTSYLSYSLIERSIYLGYNCLFVLFIYLPTRTILNLLNKTRNLFALQKNSWFLLLPLSQGIILYIFFIVAYSTENLIPGNDFFWFKFSSVVVILISVIVDCSLLFVLRSLNKKREIEQELRLIRKIQETDLLHYNAVNTLYQKERMFHHDINNKIVTILALMDNGHNEEAKSILTELSNFVSTYRLTHYCQNALFNVILSVKSSYAISLNIHTDIKATVGELNITLTDLCSILTNIWDNAIEACSNFPEKMQKVISFSSHVKNDYLIIHEKNPLYESFQERSPSRGNGLLILHHLAEKYEGALQVQIVEGSYMLSMTLKNISAQPPEI